jgi:AmmeMemoRadiSam system protein B
METTTREPAVAGAFYPGTASALERELQQLMTVSEERHQLLACVAPHAGYVYSGGVAGELYGHLELPRRVIVLGPNHTGVGAKVAVAPHQRWWTPLGEQAVDVEFAGLLVERFPDASFDENAHWREHSLEVQIPFLLSRRPDVEVVPICLSHLGLDQCLDLGRILAELIEELGEEVGLVASSDMSHYLEDERARTLDRMAIDAALERDPKSLYQTVHREGITMCGVVPATVVIEAANRLGASDAHLVAYATSGDVSGDRSAVVGYAGICVHR